MKYISVALVACSLLGSAIAGGGWSHGQYSPGSFSTTFSAPAYAKVTQAAGNSFDTILNYGPLGNFALYGSLPHSGSGFINVVGYVNAGSYPIYQYVGPNGGYSVTVFEW